MNKILFAAFLIFVVDCYVVFSQEVGPTPPAKQDADSEVVKITTSLIQLDVVVTDKNGAIVSDLKPEDFEISENGRKRQITGLTFVRSTRDLQNLAGNISLNASNSTKADSTQIYQRDVGRVLAIVVDDSRMSVSSINSTKKSLEEFVRRDVRPNDLIAIIKTSGSTGIQRKFTNNRELLMKWISEIKWQPRTSAGLLPFPPMEISFGESAKGLILGAPVSENIRSQVNSRPEVEAISNSFRDQFITVGALRNIQRTIEAMGNFRRRKAMLLVSEGINLRDVGEDGSGSIAEIKGDSKTVGSPRRLGPPPSTFNIELASPKSVRVGGKNYEISDLVKFITEIANRNSVSIFTMDSRGAVTTNLSAIDSTRGILGSGSESMSRAQIDAQTTLRNDNIRYSQETLRTMAEETGGKAFVNTNDLNSGLTAALNSQESYYLLAYHPDEDTFDPKSSRFNKITVKVSRPNVNISYRSGFFNVAFKETDDQQTRDQNAIKALLSPYNLSGMDVRVASIVAYGDQNTTIRSFISVPAKNLTTTPDPNGGQATKFDIIIAVIGEDGIPIGFSAKNFTVVFDAKHAADIPKVDIANNFSFRAARAGNYTIKVLVRDNLSSVVGTSGQTISAPNLEKDKIALSGLLLQNFSLDEWQAAQSDAAVFRKMLAEKTPNDMAVRKFKRGSILGFIYSIYAAQEIVTNGPAKLTASTKLMTDGRPIISGNPEEFVLPADQKNVAVTRRGAINLASSMIPGKYSLQLTISTASGDKTEIENIDFEIVE